MESKINQTALETIEYSKLKKGCRYKELFKSGVGHKHSAETQEKHRTPGTREKWLWISDIKYLHQPKWFGFSSALNFPTKFIFDG